jgi:hypothetical protein
MNVVVACPTCGEARSYGSRDLDQCRSCRAAFPSNLRDEALHELARKRPLLLTLLAVLLSFFAGVGFLIVITTAFSSGPFTVNGASATRQEFTGAALPMLPVFVAAGFVAYAIWASRTWGRPAIIAYFGLVTIVSGWLPRHVTTEVPGGTALVESPPGHWIGLLMMVLLVAFWGWYLYAKRNVVAYYHEMTGRGADA